MVMRKLVIVIFFLAVSPYVSLVNAVGNWGGVNSFFLHTLSDTDRAAHLDALHAKGVKVIRIFLSGVGAGDKGSSSVGVSELEPTTVGVYNDKVLGMVDVLMTEVHKRNMLLNIALHDRYSLGCWAQDAYVNKYKIPNTAPNCNTAVNQPRVFYTNATAQADFDNRIVHILTHKNPYFNNRTWGEINEAVFAFAPENEAQGHMSNPDWGWACRRAKTMKNYIKNGVLIATGGGVDFPSSIQDDHFQCPYIDVISLHSYSSSTSEFSSQIASAVSKAKSNNKRVIMEEFGATGSDSSKSAALSTLIDSIISGGIPFLPWEFLRPTTTDYEFYTDGSTWSSVGCRCQLVLTKPGAFAWNEISSDGGNNTPCSGKKDDWELCASSSECKDGCCSKQYSDDGKYKCTPGGTVCI